MSDIQDSKTRLRGVVLSFLPRKGYGFISGPDGEKLFVHFSDLRGKGFRTLEPGEKVEYTRVTGERGPHAIDVVRLDPPATPAEDEPSGQSTRRTW